MQHLLPFYFRNINQRLVYFYRLICIILINNQAFAFAISNVQRTSGGRIFSSQQKIGRNVTSRIQKLANKHVSAFIFKES